MTIQMKDVKKACGPNATDDELKACYMKMFRESTDEDDRMVRGIMDLIQKSNVTEYHRGVLYVVGKILDA